MITVLRVRLTSSAPKVMDLGRCLAKKPAKRSERVMRIGARELMTIQRIPAKGVRKRAAYSFDSCGFAWIARAPTVAYRIASSFRATMLDPIAVEARPENPMKYARVA